MTKLYIFDPTSSDKLSTFRGGGRIIQILKENLSEAIFISDLSNLPKNQFAHDRKEVVTSTLFIPFWKPYEEPVLEKRIADKQYLMIYDCIPLKYSSHFPAGLRGKLNLLRNKRSLKYFDKIITISNHSKSDIIHYLNVPSKKVEVIHPTLTQVFQKIPLQRSKATIPTSHLPHLASNYFIYVGDVNWNKNLVNLAKAIKNTDTTCVFVGKMFHAPNFKLHELNHPWLNEYKEFLRLSKDDKRFIFTGYVSDDELIQLYKRATCNILVSRDEGSGFSYLEAASQSCPSILSDIPVFHETAHDTALFAKPEDPNDIADKIKKIFSDKKMRNELGEKAFKHIKLKFNSKNFQLSANVILASDARPESPNSNLK